MMTPTHAQYARQMRRGMQLYLFPQYKSFRRKTIDAGGLSPDDAVLDFGCGVGLLEEFIVPRLSEKGSVLGVDIGVELIETARSTFASAGNCEFAVIDTAGVLPSESHRFDLIVCNLVFHLLTRTQKDTVLKEFLRVLKPGGRVIMAEIGQPSNLFGWWIKFLTLHYWVKKWPYEINSVDSFEGRLEGIIRAAGFSDVRRVARTRGYIDFFRCAP
jgi:ubiquinone/menaquinone biosynthesis C-methylase UbiE